MRVADKQPAWFRISGTQAVYLALFMAVLGVFGAYLFSFTVFEGYATLSSDAFSFIREARIYSPYNPPSEVILQTLPEHNRAPGFPWLLALSGAAESTLMAHILVSTLLLIAIALASWLAVLQVGWRLGLCLVVVYSLLPGVVLSTMPILSESAYMVWSFGALLLYFLMRHDGTQRNLWLPLTVCLVLAILTRTVGLSLALAVILVQLLRRDAAPGDRFLGVMAGITAIGLWLLWNAFAAADGVPGQLDRMRGFFMTQDRTFIESLQMYLGLVLDSRSRLPLAWDHYLALGNSSLWSFIITLVGLGVCLVSAAIRAFRLKLDAVYILLNLAINFLWPHAEAWVRFLHPLVLLLLLQPVALMAEARLGKPARFKTVIVVGLLFAIGIDGLRGQVDLLSRRAEALRNAPDVVHSFEWYDLNDRARALLLSMAFQHSMRLMQESAEVIPAGAVVATVKHEAYMLLANRQAVMLTGRVPYLQQLCNFEIQRAEYIFLPSLSSDYVPDTEKLLADYAEISEFSLSASSGQHALAHIIKLDSSAIGNILRRERFVCRRVRML